MADNQELKLKIQGLYTHPNTLSEVPEGALSVADNIVIDRESIAESRRGFKQYGVALTDPTYIFNFSETLMVQDAGEIKYDDGSGGFTLVGNPSIDKPSDAVRIKTAEANNNVYITSNKGIKKLDVFNGTIVNAGAPAGLDLNLTLTGATGFMANNSRVGYRIVWGTEDANENLVLGAPGTNIQIANTSGGTRNVILNFTIPTGLTSSWFYQIYRTIGSVGSTVDAGDELFLVDEVLLLAGDITAGTITYTDTTIEALLGAALYTNVAQEGIGSANSEPPSAIDLSEFRDHMFYANTAHKHTTLIQVNSNFTINDTVTIGAIILTAKAAENILAGEFIVGADVATTVQSLVKVLNRYATNTLYSAYWITEGTFVIRQRLIESSAFTTTSSNTAIFKTVLPIVSSNESKQNRVYVSKAGQPESVPSLQYLDVGREDKAILRIVSVRDATFVLKEDGVFRITGSDISNFYVEQHDTTITFIGPETIVAFDNSVLAMTDQGVVSISVSGLVTISRMIENTLLELVNLTDFNAKAFAISYDNDRKYMLAVPTSDASFSAEQFFVYNNETLSWTRWLLAIEHGIVSANDGRLYLIRKTDDQILQERKSYTLDDYADDQFDVTIASFTSSTVTLVSATDVEVGYTLEQGNIRVVVDEIAGNVLTVNLLDQPWVAAAAIVYKPIDVAMEWTEDHTGNPGVLKHFSEISYLFQETRFKNITAAFATNFQRSFKDVLLQAKSNGPWGEFAWGEEEWGGGYSGFQVIRTYVPLECTRAHWLYIRLETSQAFQAFSLAGASVFYNIMSNRFKG